MHVDGGRLLLLSTDDIIDKDSIHVQIACNVTNCLLKYIIMII